MPLMGPVGPSASRTTGLVTPCRVRLPLIVRWLPDFVTEVLVKVAVLKWAVSNQAAPEMSVSRPDSPVSTLETSMVALTVDLEMSASLKLMAAVTPKWPRTVEMAMWRMLKLTSLWAGSAVQLEVCALARGAARVMSAAVRAKRFMRGSLLWSGWSALKLRASGLEKGGPRIALEIG